MSREHHTVTDLVLVNLRGHDRRIYKGIIVSRIVLLLFMFIFLYT